MSTVDQEIAAVSTMAAAAADRFGSPVLDALAGALASAFTSAAVRGKLDEWDAARAASDGAFAAKFGTPP